MLDNIVASPSLNPVDTEKGERYFSVDRGDWYRKSIFGIFSASCEGNRAANGVVDDGLTAAIEAFPIWLCDDDTREAADFIGLDPDSKKIVLVHAKVGHLRAGGGGFNVGALQDVGRQALASLSFISLGIPSPVWTLERWQDEVQANAVRLNGRSRVFRNERRMTAFQLNEALHAACKNPSYDKEIWIVGAKMARYQTLLELVENNAIDNRLRQFLMHWEAMQTACARANTRLKFYC